MLIAVPSFLLCFGASLMSLGVTGVLVFVWKRRMKNLWNVSTHLPGQEPQDFFLFSAHQAGFFSSINSTPEICDWRQPSEKCASPL